MASNVLCGQAGLRDLPSLENADGKIPRPSMADAKLHPYLRVERKQLKTDASVGLEVFKISKVGHLEYKPTNCRCDFDYLLYPVRQVK